MTYILAIANQKGGVGKTTSAVNIAACLAMAGKKTLLVDLDPQGNASVGVGADLRNLETSIYDVLFDPNCINDTIIPTSIDNLSLLPSSLDLAAAELELVESEKREFFLKAALSAIDGKFDVIVVDCAPALGLLTVNALTAASGVLVPLQCEYFSLEGISHLVRTIAAIKNKLNPNLNIMGIALTMYDRRANLTTMVEEDVRSYFKELVFTTVIPRNVRVSEAPSHGLPVVIYDQLARGSVAYIELTNEVIKRIN